MTDYIRQHEDPRYPFERRETERLAVQFDTDATVTDGIVRWDSNDQIPPQDVLLLWQHLGKSFDFDSSSTARQTETAAFLAQCRKDAAENPHVPDAEELGEMRASFGTDVEVVNLVTRQRMRI